MNVPSYFLIVLGGFAIVWGFRWAKYRGRSRKEISEFEYAAFSAVWGSLLLYVLLGFRNLFGWPSVETLGTYVEVPFIISPVIVLIGLGLGIGIGYIWKRTGN